LARFKFVAVAGVAVLASGAALADAWKPIGHSAEGERLARMESSPQYDEGIFVNPQPMWNGVKESIGGLFRGSSYATPSEPLPVVFGDGSRFTEPPDSGLRVTWLGHSTQFIELDGATILTDPIFGGRASPFSWVGPATWYEPPIPLDAIPVPDLVLISHDHYDHLQFETIAAMADWDTRFVTPLGVGAHLEYWGVEADRITELDWWEETQIAGLTLAATPARHASGRHAFDQNHTLWASYALIGPDHRVWFSGDTGLFPALDSIGALYGPFDLTMVEVGAYDRGWPDWHLGPEQAVDAHERVRGRVFMPIHWGMMDLSLHGWTEPIERVVVATSERDIPLAAPRPGASFEVDTLAAWERWWPELPWQTVEEHPVVATGMED